MKRPAYLITLVAFCIIFSALISYSADNQYAGVQTCRGCHEQEYDSYSKSVHAKKAIASGPANLQACESCHGPGSGHAEKGGGRGVAITGFGSKADAAVKTGVCLSCHEQTTHLAFWSIGRHKSAGISCDMCHSMHRGMEKGLKKRQPDLCFDCHKDIRIQSNKQSHHPLREGRIGCSDCHNPHGGFGQKMIRADSVNELCYKCHADKRGPFRFEHSPVVENCLNCHEAHGSNHNKLLVRKTPQLCQSCHQTSLALTHTNVPYTGRDGFAGNASGFLVSRACVNCHTNIHGSNGPASDGRRFFR